MIRITETQKGMFLEWNADRASLQYNITGTFRLPASVDIERFEAALRATLDAHPVFRTRFFESEGEIVQDFDSTSPIPVNRLTIGDDREVERFLTGFPRPFDLLGGELARFALVSTRSDVRFVFDISHTIFDGSTWRVFFGEIVARYEGRTVPEEGATYAEFAAAEEASFATPQYAEAAAEHSARFVGVGDSVPEDPSAGGAGDHQLIESVVNLNVEEIRRGCDALGVTPNLFFSGVFARVLAAYTNEKRVMFLTVNHGRKDPAFRNTIGPCIKTIPVLGDINGELDIADYFKSFKLHRAGVYPFTHAARDLGLKPGFMFVFQDGTIDLSMTFGGERTELTMLSGAGAGELPTMQIYREGEGENAAYRCLLSCLAGKYTFGFLERFNRLFASTAANFASGRYRTLREVPLLTPDEQARMLELSQGETLAYDEGKTFVGLFREIAAADPTRTAVVDCEGSITYGELDELSDVVATELLAAGVKPGGFVGLMLPRRRSFIVAAIAVQKCGAGYVPIDSEYPKDRIAYMLEDSGATLLVDTERFAVLSAGRSSGSFPEVSPDDPAYMIYTSGSTGKPKGVVVPQRALVNLCMWEPSVLGFDRESRIGAHPSFSFDASVPDLFPPLAVGAAVHIYSEELRKDLGGMRDYIVRNRISGGTMSTQIGMALLDAYPELPLSYVFLGGEKLMPTAKTDVKIFNGYGPTEFCVCSSYHRVNQSAAGEIPIGRPAPNTASYVCDVLGQLLPRGMTGELCLAGPQLADGYWHNPEKTKAAFTPIPFQASPSFFYHTGDFARYNDEGLLEYRGRIDFQVKLRGFRIEIGEVEHAASVCDGVDAVIALVREIAGSEHLVLYYTGTASKEAVKAKMSETLTGYMIPGYFVRLASMPMTPVGKIDRKALPLPELSDDPIEEPADERERKMLSTVKAVLKTEHIGVTHDFNRLGLTSLGAMTLIAKLRAEAGVVVTMRQLIDNPTIRSLAASVSAEPAPSPSSRRRPKRSAYPISENQRGVYSDWLREPGATQYNVPAGIVFPGLDARRLADAVTKVINAHPALKTRFAVKDGEIVQLRRDDEQVEVEIVKTESVPDAEALTRAVRPFSFNTGDLVRAAVYESPEASTLFLDVHHTVFDGFSLGVFIAELMRGLDGLPLKGEEKTVFEAALDERDYLESELLAEDDEWFSKYLEGCESTRVEPSSIGAGGRPGEAAKVSAKVGVSAIAARCAELAVSASDWFLASFMELLRRIGRSDDVQIAFVSAGRREAELADAIGMFVRTVPVRNVKSERTFSSTVLRLRNDVRDLIDRDRYSYARAAERLGLHPEIIFAFEGGLFDLPHGARIIEPRLDTVKCPLSVLVTPQKDDFELAFEYDASLYSERDMRTLLRMFATLAENAVSTDDLKSIALVSRSEADSLLALSKGSALTYDESETFISCFRAHAAADPTRTAVVDCEGSITYGELDELTDRIAAELIAAGVKPGGFVGLMLPRRRSFVAAVIAIQKCGAGYVPIDSEYPKDRIEYMLEDSGATLLIDVAFFEKLSAATRVVDGSLAPVSPAAPAYMIYTSGSTGRPKGVVVPQRALRHLCEWERTEFGICPGKRISVHASFSFDASVIDVFPALANGAELHVLAEELRKDLPAIRDYLVSRGITSCTMSTQIGMALVDAYPDLPLETVMFGGEKLMPTAKTAIQLVNGYGPTEFCVCSSFHRVDQSADGDIPIGRPVPGTSSFIVDRYGQLLPQGTIGELCLAGPQIADGYWHNPEKTKAAFTPVPFQTSPSFAKATEGRQTSQASQTIFYHTGDLARYNDAGLLEYCGRIDFQVKLRGFRIEIGEIEHVASTYPGVGAVAAEVREVGGVKHLVLYYSAEGAIDEGALRSKLAESLAAYMVPDYFVRLDEMPITPNGKINRKALPVPSVSAEAEFVEPKPGTEAEIAAAYAETLNLERFGATTDFFLAGGTSLIGIKAVVALQKRGLDVQYGDLFKYKTPRLLAAFLSGGDSVADASGDSKDFDFGAYDYRKIDGYLAKTRAELFDGFKVHSLGDVLLTGGTGYLGVHILRYLLERTSSSVVLLIRSKKNATPERRLDSAYVYYFGERVPARHRDRISFIEGDITDGDLATKLSGSSVSTVINCAAMVKHYVADDAMDRVNVGGVENLVAFCSGSGARFIQTSTYSVGGAVGKTSPAVLDERSLFVGQTSDNDYVRTKFTAERLVLEAVAAGRVRGKVMRLGNLMGRESDGEFQMNVGANAFVNSLRSYKAIGAFPLEELAGRIEMSPIDRVAEAVCLLATTPDDMTVFHPFNTYALDLGAVLGAMNRRGYNVDWVSREEFAARVEALRNDPSHADELQGVLHYARRHLEDSKITPVVNAWTTTVLYRLGFRWKPAEDRYLENFFEMLDGLAVFD